MWIALFIVGLIMLTLLIIACAEDPQEWAVKDVRKWRRMKISAGIDPTYDEHGRPRYKDKKQTEKIHIITIEFKDGRKLALHPTCGETGRAIRDFREGKNKIVISTIEGWPEKTVVSTSEIRSIIPELI